jgi:Sec-independent protein translocase protein TatA
MLNFSIGEILVIVCVACLVFKPEELPGLANKIGRLFAKAQNKISALKLLFFEKP